MGISAEIVNPGPEGIAVLKLDRLSVSIHADDMRVLYYSTLGIKGDFDRNLKDIVLDVTPGQKIDIDVPEDNLRAERSLALRRVEVIEDFKRMWT